MWACSNTGQVVRSSAIADEVADAKKVEQENALADTNGGALTLVGDIKSVFRERNCAAMIDFFDLWSFDDVKENGDAILAAVGTGSMPCDTPWSTEKVDLLERGVDSGTPW